MVCGTAAGRPFRRILGTGTPPVYSYYRSGAIDILKALGLGPGSLQSVRNEGTQVLPDVTFGFGSDNWQFKPGLCSKADSQIVHEIEPDQKQRAWSDFLGPGSLRLIAL